MIKRIMFILLAVFISAVSVSHAQDYLNGNENYPKVITYQGKSSYIDLASVIINKKEVMPNKSIMNLVSANMAVVDDSNNQVTYYPYTCKICCDNGKLEIFTYYPSGYGLNVNPNDVAYRAATIVRDYLGYDKLSSGK